MLDRKKFEQLYLNYRNNKILQTHQLHQVHAAEDDRIRQNETGGLETNVVKTILFVDVFCCSVHVQKLHSYPR